MASSYNGWPASPDPDEINVDAGFVGGGVRFPGGVRGGDVSTVLGYVADQLAARVETPQVNPDGTGYGCWGWNYRANVNNPSTLSCHSSATAIDWIAPAHPNGAVNTFTPAQEATIYDILGEVGGAVQWGGDYTGTVDEMHFEIIVDADYLAEVAAGLGGIGPSGEWDAMASQAEVQAACDAAIHAAVPGIVNDVVASVLRAGEFRLTHNDQAATVNGVITDILRAEEFQLTAAQRQALGV